MGGVLFIFDNRGYYYIFMEEGPSGGYDPEYPFDEGKYWIVDNTLYMMQTDEAEKKDDVKKRISHTMEKITETEMSWESSYFSGNNSKKDDDKSKIGKITFHRQKSSQTQNKK